MKIKVIFTGGTISSEISGKGISVNSDKNSNKILINNFYTKTGLSDVEFNISQPLNTLSENMTIFDWNILLYELRKINFNDYDGIIIAHGTDTLAYTTNMLSIMLSGIDIPVVMVSSNYILSDDRANGNDNFINAVFFISHSKYKGVYAIYRNNKGENVVYLGSRLKQCEALTNEYSSTKSIDFGRMENGIFIPTINENNPNPDMFKEKDLLLYKINELKPCVLSLKGYTGLDYNNITPTDNIRAIVQYVYHGGTASSFSDNIYCTSYIDFYNKYKSNIDFYIAPLESKQSDHYASTNEIIESGIIPLYDISEEMAYIKLTIAYSTDDEIVRKYVLDNNIFYERVI